jgi:hypothetical protein
MRCGIWKIAYTVRPTLDLRLEPVRSQARSAWLRESDDS